MTGSTMLAPGVPHDYYRRIFDAEEQHWWFRGMRAISAALLGDRLTGSAPRILDAGCGTGGFLRWSLDRGAGAAAGADLAAAAIELARERVPEADLRVAPLRSLPFEDGSFDVVVVNDVLQHVHERELAESLAELRRVLAGGGTMLVRTNGARRHRREREDWRAYDRSSLAAELEGGGFDCERVTYANTLFSLYGALRGRSPRAPSESEAGVPVSVTSPLVSAVGVRVLGWEASWLSRPGRRLPYGHTLFAVASPRSNATCV